MHLRTLLLPLALLAAALTACGPGEERPAVGADGTSSRPAAGIVDSALPIAELLARFRATVADTPATLAGGADSPEALARALLAALVAHDTAAVRALVVSRAEFAWLYYPHSRYTRAPYELGPELVWLTSSAASEKGAGRLLARYGGRALRFERLACEDAVAVEGPNTIVSGCLVRFAVPDSGVREARLFGALLRRDGRYKFLSYANDL